MRVGEEDKVNIGCLDGKLLVLEYVSPLLHSAVDNEALSVCLY